MTSRQRTRQSMRGDAQTYIDWLTTKDYDPTKEKRRNAALGKRAREAHEYLSATHQYQMKIGASKIGPAVEMTGREAKVRNAALEEKFVAALDAKKSVRLARWCLVGELHSWKARYKKDFYDADLRAKVADVKAEIKGQRE